MNKVSSILSDPDKWTQGGMARLEPPSSGLPGFDNPPVEYDHPGAQCFCLLGAACKAYGEGSKDYRSFLFHVAHDLKFPHSGAAKVADWNDDKARKFEDVADLLKRIDHLLPA